MSQIPAQAESASLSDTIYALTQDLKKPEAADPETRLRILEVRGMIENNYDASLARQTWSQVAVLARNQRPSASRFSRARRRRNCCIPPRRHDDGEEGGSRRPGE